MKIQVGNHYTFDDGNKYGKVIMFITNIDKYVGENVYYYDTISLNSWGEVYVKDFELSFFNSENIRLSTPDEIEEIRKRCPVDYKWIEQKTIDFIREYWGMNEQPKIILDPNEPLERLYEGAYDPNLQAIIFRSEFLSLLTMERIEKILKHELCHWYLHVTGQDFRDKDVRFAKELVKLGLDDTVNMLNEDAKLAYEKAKGN